MTETFSSRLAEKRIRMSCSKSDMARKLGMTPAGYCRLEEGIVGRTFEKLPVIAKALGCRIDDLFPEMDEPGAAAPEDDVNELDELVI